MKLNLNFQKHYFLNITPIWHLPALVTALTSRLEMAISIDNGIMHMMSLANVPMIVLFGPTKPEKFAPDGKKITILDSKKLYKTTDISRIQIEDVLKYID